MTQEVRRKSSIAPIHDIQTLVDETTEIAVVIPTFNSRDHIRETIDALVKELKKTELNYQILVIDDASEPSRSSDYEALVVEYSSLIACRVFANRGQHYTSLLGLKALSNAEMVLTIDDDQGIDGVLLRSACMKLRESDIEMILFQREDSERSRRRELISKLLRNFVSVAAGRKIDFDLSSTRLISRAVVQRLSNPREGDYISVELLRVVGAILAVPLSRSHAARRPSNYTIRKLVSTASGLLLRYTTSLTKGLALFASSLAVVSSTVSFGTLLYASISGETAPGWATIIALIGGLFGGLFLLIALLTYNIDELLRQNQVLKILRPESPVYCEVVFKEK